MNVNPRIGFLFFLLFGSCGGAVAADLEDPTSVTVGIGGQSITLVAPSGHVEITVNREKVRRYFEVALPRENRHLATFASIEDVRRMEIGEEMRRFASVQTVRSAEQEVLGEKDFQGLREMLRVNWRSVLTGVADEIAPEMDRSSERVSREFDMEVDFTGDELLPIEVFQDDADAFGTMMLLRSQIKVENETLKVELVATNTMMRVKDRLVVLNYYQDHKSEADRVSAREAAMRWAEAIRSANTAP